ncbi:MAG: heavy metal-binding domain-containing protein [Ignavibacteria bacterium]
MKKIKLLSISLLVILLMFSLISCGKSDKDVTLNDKKTEQKETLDTSRFYTTPDFKFWQNYPGKTPDGIADMGAVIDSAQINQIKKAISGENGENVYTCEMHPQIHQNYAGKCPICKMDLMRQEYNGKQDTSTQKHMKMN